MRQAIRAAVVSAAVLALLPGHALGKAGKGSRETVDMTFSTVHPGSPAGFAYSASFRDPANPNGTPPPLRRLVITSPHGAVIDTSALPRCTATDAQLKQQGESACPANTRIGAGTADVKPVLFPAQHYTTTIFNGDRQQVELLRASPPTPSVVVRGYIRGDDLDSPLPTCISGGSPPDGCPSDQASLLRNQLVIPKRGGYFTTPSTCPSSRAWRSRVKLYYGDGVLETVTTTQPCEPAPTRLSVRPRRVRRLSRRRFRFRASVLLGGRWRPLGDATIRAGSRTLRSDRAGRASGRIRFKRSGRRRIRLGKAGYGRSSARVRVRSSP